MSAISLFVLGVGRRNQFVVCIFGHNKVRDLIISINTSTPKCVISHWFT